MSILQRIVQVTTTQAHRGNDYERASTLLTAEIETLRRQRLTSRQIGERLGISKATVHRVLDRRNLNCLSSVDPPEPVQRYEHESAGSVLHLDIKKLSCIGHVGHRIHGNRRTHARGVGWEFVHVAIDDHTRLAFSRILCDERHPSAVAFLLAAVEYYRALGIEIRSILTDNGSCYRSKAFRKLCTELGLRHRFTKPYRPRTNGKAERLIQTLLREWAYAAAYENSLQRTAHLPFWLHHYNWHRPQGKSGAQTAGQPTRPRSPQPPETPHLALWFHGTGTGGQLTFRRVYTLLRSSGALRYGKVSTGDRWSARATNPRPHTTRATRAPAHHLASCRTLDSQIARKNADWIDL